MSDSLMLQLHKMKTFLSYCFALVKTRVKLSLLLHWAIIKAFKFELSLNCLHLWCFIFVSCIDLSLCRARWASFYGGESCSINEMKTKSPDKGHVMKFFADNLLGISWVDSSWVPILNPGNVLDYFSERSNPFYERSCNNEVVKMQRLSLEHLK